MLLSIWPSPYLQKYMCKYEIYMKGEKCNNHDDDDKKSKHTYKDHVKKNTINIMYYFVESLPC